jgi:hypothetical protein
VITECNEKENDSAEHEKAVSPDIPAGTVIDVGDDVEASLLDRSFEMQE